MDASVFGLDTSRSRDPVSDLRSRFGNPSYLDASRLLKSSGLKYADRIMYFRNKAWLVDLTGKIKNKEQAVKKGNVVLKSLKGKRTLPSSEPYLHDLEFYVKFNDDLINIKNKRESEDLIDKVLLGTSVSDVVENLVSSKLGAQ